MVIASDQRSQRITDTPIARIIFFGVRLPFDHDRRFQVFQSLSGRPKRFHSDIGNKWYTWLGQSVLNQPPSIQRKTPSCANRVFAITITIAITTSINAIRCTKFSGAPVCFGEKKKEGGLCTCAVRFRHKCHFYIGYRGMTKKVGNPLTIYGGLRARNHTKKSEKSLPGPLAPRPPESLEKVSKSAKLVGRFGPEKKYLAPPPPPKIPSIRCRHPPGPSTPSPGTPPPSWDFH